MENRIIKKGLALGIVLIFFGTFFYPIINGKINEINDISINSEYQKEVTTTNEIKLDMEFIRSLTENLSNIIFTEYNESAGEIAKGRVFGSKGEHKAAKILFENMTEIGLNTVMQPIENIEKPSISHPIDNFMYPLSELTYAYEVLDYNLILRNESNGNETTVDCQITPIADPNANLSKTNSYTNERLKIRKRPRSLSDWVDAFLYDQKGEDYLFIEENGKYGAKSRNPDVILTPFQEFLRERIYPIRSILSMLVKKIEGIEKHFFNKLEHYKGAISYDFNNDTHNLGSNTNGKLLPFIRINGTIGRRIFDDTEHHSVDFYIKQRFNTTVESYNVIGWLNPNNSPVRVIVCCLYDSVWCQGTADSAIGMAIVLGIAKYFTENNLEPKYNLSFIGFAGEESGNRGARYYEAIHRCKNIKYVVDMNQVGFYQKDPKLTLNLIFNKIGFMNEIWEVANRINYEERVNGTAYIAKRWWPEGVLSNQYVFNHRSKTVCFLKDFPWILHHRDGLNHEEGDVMKYFDWNDTWATGEIALNVTKYLTLESEEKIKTPNFNKWFLHETNSFPKFLQNHPNLFPILRQLLGLS
jgi:hypothetical protein